LAIALYGAVVIVGSAVLAPAAFWLAQTLGHTLQSDWLAGQPFRRVFNRLVLAVAVIGLWPLLRAVGVRSWAALGYPRRAAWGRHLLLGWIIGIGSVGLAVALLCLSGLRAVELQRAPAELVRALARFFLTGMVVGLIEETVFRGGLQGALQRAVNGTAALLLASAVYSAVHFLKPKGVDVAADAVGWSSGFQYLAAVLTRSAHAPGTAVGFVSLFLVGCILGWAFFKTKALYLSIGVHAGWVMAHEFARWLGVRRILQEPLVWPMLLAVFAALAWLCRNRLRALTASAVAGRGCGDC
jgi:membrane protease YdiL (CAAX protease family)